MNVAFDSWIPTVTGGGDLKLASLYEALTEGENFADLAVRPHERVALMRLFLCVAHAALEGPKSRTEWTEAKKFLPDAACQYLNKWKDSFELFHPTKPWLQVAELDPSLSVSIVSDLDGEAGWTGIHKLDQSRASGNNSTLFDHSANSPEMPSVTPADISLHLLTFQNYFVAGGKAASRMWGTTEMVNPPNPKGGPCSGKSILFSFLRGGNLSETIYRNLLPYEDLRFIYGRQDVPIGKPIWEKPIRNPADSLAIENATTTYLGRLVPQTRILRVKENCRYVLLGAGFSYPKFQDEKNPFYPDVFATVVLNKDGEPQLLSARPSISTWRELHALSVKEKNDSSSARGPLCLRNVPDNESVDIVVCAMITNPKQAAEIVNLVDSVFHIPSALLQFDGNMAYASGIREATSTAWRLGNAVETYRETIDGGWPGRIRSAGPGKAALRGKLHAGAFSFYWTTIEKKLGLLIAHVESIGTDDVLPTRDAWRKMLFATACEAYCTVCGQETPRQVKAFTVGLKRLITKPKSGDVEEQEVEEAEE
jgi:CRISPR system Cascade subunit CasA